MSEALTRAGAHRGGEPQHVVPVRGDQLLVDGAGDERRERRPGRGRAEGIEPALGQVRDARREPEAEQMREREDVVADPAAVGVVDGDAEVRLVVEQAVDDVRGLAGGRDRHGVVGRVAGRVTACRSSADASRP